MSNVKNKYFLFLNSSKLNTRAEYYSLKVHISPK